MFNTSRKEFVTRLLIIAAIILFVVNINSVLNFLQWIYGIIFPFLVGLGVAYIWNLIMRFFETKVFGNIKSEKFQKFNRPLSMLVALIIILLIIFLVLYLVVPQIYSSIAIIGENIPKLADELYTWVTTNPNNSPVKNMIQERLEGVIQDWDNIENTIANFVKENIGGFLGSTFNVINSVLGAFFNAFTITVFATYMLLNKEKIAQNLDEVTHVYFNRNLNKKVKYFFKVMDDKFSSFFKGEVISALAISLILYFAMLIFGIPYALTIAVVVGVTALVPMLGAFIGGGIGFLMIAAVDFKQALVFLAVLLVVQQLEGNLIYPKLVGDSVNLPGIWTFSAVIIGGAVAGPIGMILFVPLVAGIYQILKTDVRTKLAEQAESLPENQ